LFPAQPSFPIVRLRISTTKAAEPFQCDIASVPTTRADSLWRWTRALRAPQKRNRRNEGTGKPIELGPVKLSCSKHGRSLNHGKHSIKCVLRLQLAVQYLFFIKD
jgi:hypothetical protein